MKKKIYNAFTILTLVLFSCTPYTEPTNSDVDSKDKATKPIKEGSTTTELKSIGQFQVTGGYLYIYTFGKDTIYWAEGRSSSYPVGLQIK